MPVGIDANGNVTYIPNSPLEAGLRGAVEGAAGSAPVRGIRSMLGGLGHLLGAPARATAAVGQNISGIGSPISPMDAALYGRDMNTGAEPQQYGTLLSKVAYGEDAPRSGMAALTEDVGNLVGDPLVALGVSKLAGTAIAGDVGVKAQERALSNLGASRMVAKQPAVAAPRPSALLDTDLTTGQHAGRHIGVRDFDRQVSQWARKAPAGSHAMPGGGMMPDAAMQSAALQAPVRRVPPASAAGDMGYGSYDAAMAEMEGLMPELPGGGLPGGTPANRSVSRGPVGTARPAELETQRKLKRSSMYLPKVPRQ